MCLLLQSWCGVKMSGVPVNSSAMPHCGRNCADSSRTFSLGLGLLCSCGPALGAGGGCGQQRCSSWVPQIPKRWKPKREYSWGGGDVQRSCLREQPVGSLCCSARPGRGVRSLVSAPPLKKGPWGWKQDSGTLMRKVWRLVREKITFTQAGCGSKGRQEYHLEVETTNRSANSALRRLFDRVGVAALLGNCGSHRLRWGEVLQALTSVQGNP